MILRKVRISAALDRGAHREAERLARTPELRRYAKSLETIDKRLDAEAGDMRLNAPPELAPRVMESIRELRWLDSAGSAPSSAARPLFALCAAAGLAGVLTLGIYLAGLPNSSAPEPVQVVDATSEAVPARFRLDPAAAIVPVGRVVVERVESPLQTEAQLLRRDTQRFTEQVISSLPFAPGMR